MYNVHVHMYIQYTANCLLKEALHVTDLHSGWSFPSSHTHCGLVLKGTQRSGDYVEIAIKTYVITYMCVIGIHSLATSIAPSLVPSLKSSP